MTQVNSFRDIILLVHIGPRHIKKTIHPAVLFIDIYMCTGMSPVELSVVPEWIVNIKFLYMFTQCL